MTYSLFKFIHLLGVLMVFLSIGGLIVRGFLSSDEKTLKKLGGLTYALGLMMVLFGGLGLLTMSKYGIYGWVMVKMVIWFIFGMLIAVVNRKPEHGKMLWWGSLILGAAAVYMAVVKPF